MSLKDYNLLCIICHYSLDEGFALSNQNDLNRTQIDGRHREQQCRSSLGSR